jgi:flagellar motor component MotA
MSRLDRVFDDADRDAERIRMAESYVRRLIKLGKRYPARSIGIVQALLVLVVELMADVSSAKELAFEIGAALAVLALAGKGIHDRVSPVE